MCYDSTRARSVCTHSGSGPHATGTRSLVAGRARCLCMCPMCRLSGVAWRYSVKQSQSVKQARAINRVIERIELFHWAPGYSCTREYVRSTRSRSSTQTKGGTTPPSKAPRAPTRHGHAGPPFSPISHVRCACHEKYGTADTSPRSVEPPLPEAATRSVEVNSFTCRNGQAQRTIE